MQGLVGRGGAGFGRGFQGEISKVRKLVGAVELTRAESRNLKS